MLLRVLLPFCILTAMTIAAFAQTTSAASEPAQLAKAVKALVDREFYRPVTFPAFDGQKVTREDIDRALTELGASHTRRIPPGTIDYFELADILKRGIRGDMKRLFPPSGEPTYPGIGAIARQVDGKYFVSDIYEGSPAAMAGLLVGDEILSVNGKPYEELASFEGRTGKTVKLTLLREKDSQPLDKDVRVETISPNRTFSIALSSSMRTIERDGFKLGYFRLWALGSSAIEETIHDALTDGRLRDVDGLVVDLRGRWGGMFSEVPDLLTNGSPEISYTWRDGKVSYADRTYRKPVVAIIDEGTRSSQEMFAHLLRKRGALLVGKRSAGAVLAAGAYILPDDSLLVLPVSEVRIDGQRLEGSGVAPDIDVELPLPYAAGKDPQYDAALAAMIERLCIQKGGKSARTCDARPMAP